MTERAIIRAQFIHRLATGFSLVALGPWSRRRLVVPPDLRLRFADLAPGESVMVRGVPATKPARTVNDCALAFVEPHLVGQAVREGLARRLFVEADVEAASAYVREQGG